MAEQRVIPMLAYEDAGLAADWICKVFGFRETERFHNGQGTVTDVVLELDGGTVLVGHPSDAYQGPRRHAQACALARQWLETPLSWTAWSCTSMTSTRTSDARREPAPRS